MSSYEQYLICKERGHVVDTMRGSISNASYNALAWYTCKYCNTEFASRTTTEQLERNAPKPNDPVSNLEGRNE